MGLDITAFSDLKKLDVVLDEDGEPINPETREPIDYDLRVYANPDFPGRADGVEDRAHYTADDSFGFRAGSYSGYNRWRDELARLAGYPEVTVMSYGREQKTHCAACWSGQEGPFSELINFSDCEGTIGPVVSAKLAKDFADFQETADAFDWSCKYHNDLYSDWRKAFEMAAKNGAVNFH